MIINIRSIPARGGKGETINMIGSELAFAGDEEQNVMIDTPRTSTTSQMLKGRVTGKEREAGGFEMIGMSAVDNP